SWQTAVEWSVSVLANTKLTTFTAVFYWFTLKRDEPFFSLKFSKLYLIPDLFPQNSTKESNLPLTTRIRTITMKKNHIPKVGLCLC
ncbi:hypothetical protein, partial [Pectobacterium versatile]|uniref:hypothetical protein n=1 Tax=Pectobacterium versatile TaxID=2488639 RepID=UPI001F247306